MAVSSGRSTRKYTHGLRFGTFNYLRLTWLNFIPALVRQPAGQLPLAGSHLEYTTHAVSVVLPLVRV